MLFRCARSDAKTVENVPAKGSKIVSPTNENIRISLYASSTGKGAGCAFAEVPGTSLLKERNHFACSSLESLEALRCSSEGFLYPPLLRNINKYSTSFLMIAFGSYGLPRK